jgi:hypothetical protein
MPQAPRLSSSAHCTLTARWMAVSSVCAAAWIVLRRRVVAPGVETIAQPGHPNSARGRSVGLI